MHARYTFQQLLGSGSFGRVYACVNQDTATTCAVKMVDIRGKQGDSTRRLVETTHELTMWKRLSNHKHVVSLLETFFSKKYAYFVMEKCECTLLQMKDAHFEEARLFSVIFPEMLMGLQHCHSRNIVHRDIKPMNFLMDVHGTVKLADFGTCVELQPSISGAVGTVPYMSPEMLRGSAYGFETDMWSYGASVYLLLYGKHPYHPKAAEAGSDKKEQKYATIMAILTDTPKPNYQSGKKWVYRRSACAQCFVKALLERSPVTRPDASKGFELLSMYRSQTPRSSCTSRSSGTSQLDTDSVVYAKDPAFDNVGIIEQPHRSGIASFTQGGACFARAIDLMTNCSTHVEESHCLGTVFSTKEKNKISRVSTMASSEDAALTNHETKPRQCLLSL